jgi:serine/threonine-protein kinase RsbW
MEKEITIASKVENLKNIEKFIEGLAAEINIDEEIYGNVMVAVLEAANNAVVHGNMENADKDVQLKVALMNNELSFIVADSGIGFDYKNIPDPTLPENIEKINGRGIFLMSKLADKLEFSRNGSMVKLVFYL